MKNYYYFPPNKPQFFFPKIEFKQFQKYYTPFSFKAKLFWVFFYNLKLVRSFFEIKEEKIPLPIAKIKEVIGLKDVVCFYNLGTEGIEQSATIIAKNKEQQHFLKFAQKKRSKELVVNETKILLDLENQTSFKTAKVLKFDSKESYAFVLTEIIGGNKVRFSSLNEDIYQLLLILGKTKKESNNQIFSHGDFCPWNMLITNQNKIVLIDWEMASYKPLGYDLFTFIFQTNFLLSPKKKNAVIIDENQLFIKKYFKEFKVENWKPFLAEFVSVKEAEELKKPTSTLLFKYQSLKDEL